MQGQLASYDPSSGEILGEVTATPISETPRIVARAREASRPWGAMSLRDRAQAVEHAFKHAEPIMRDLAEHLSREMGKDIRRSTGEVAGTVQGGAYRAASVREALQPRSTAPGTRIEYRPLGVAAVISPWNYPLAMAANLLVPALVAGNSVVFKPSEETPLVAQMLVERLNEVLPAGVLQTIYGDGEQGRALVESNINLIAFTGSMATGRDIMARAASGLKRLVMELGGNDPMIVLEDADLENAARFAAASSFENAGQMCTSTERIYVHESIADRFEKLVTDLSGRYRVGPWDMAGVNIGPIVNARQHAKIVEHIRDAEAKGAKILLGGPHQKPPYIMPTVIADMRPDMLMEQEETFGPVVAISRFSDVDEAVRRANDSVYGLGAVVFGKRDAGGVAARLEAGMIGINQGVGGMGDAPWVGAKQSGFGFHGSPEGHRLFTQTCVVNH